MANFEVTEVTVRPFASKGKPSSIKAFVDIVLNDAMAIKGLKVIDGKNGLFIAMPSIKNKQGEFVDIAHPINKDARAILDTAIMNEFKKTYEDEKLFE